MRVLSAALLSATMGFAVVPHALAQPADEWDDQAVAKAIDQGKAFLWAK